MSDEKRRREVMVRLNEDELARLDELRPAVTARAVYLRDLLREPAADRDVADHREALAILSEMARAGRVTAAIALDGRSDTRTTGTSTMSLLGYSTIELLEGLEDAQSGLRDLEEAVEGMKDPPDDLVEAVDRIRRALVDL